MKAFQLVEQEEARSQQYRTDLPVYAYIRFSTMGQVRNSLQSKKMQDDRMRQKLDRIGFTDIRVKDKDEGISAQKGIDERSDLADIYEAIRLHTCGAIAAYDASRLWRDRDRVHFNDFILRIKPDNIPVILNNRTYWPRVKEDMEALRVEFEYSQKALDQFYDKANPARQEAILSGSYGGHCLPMGYVVVGEKGEKKYAVYEPHAKLIRWLFKRYKELDGNIGRLGRELVAIDFHFPDFDRDALRAMGADTPHVAMHHDSKGYKLQSRGGLVSVLTNRAYIGWYCYESVSEESRVFQGEFVKKDAHTAIVAYDAFLFAYSRLSKTTLDGEENTEKPKVNRLYGVGCKALLENVLENNGTKCYAMAHEQNYSARTYSDAFKSVELIVSIDTLDRAVDAAIKVMLVALEQRHHEGLQDVLHAQLTALQQENTEESNTIDTALSNVDKAIAGWELDKASSREQGNKKGLDDANRRLAELYRTRDSLIEKAKITDTEKQEIVKTKSLLDQAVAGWDAMRFESKQQFVRVLIEKVNIEDVAPHILKIAIHFKAPFSTVMTGHLWRRKGSKPGWSTEENTALKALYPHADRAVVLEAIPMRTWESIMQQATILSATRVTRLNTSTLNDGMTVADDRYLATLAPYDRLFLEKHIPAFQLPESAHAAIQAGIDHMSITRKDDSWR